VDLEVLRRKAVRNLNGLRHVLGNDGETVLRDGNPDWRSEI
jgi:hypothetical protein